MCNQCEKNPVYEFTNKRKLCAKCFLKWFRKKVFYTIRKFNLIRREDVVGFKLERDFRGVVLKDILEMLENKNYLELVKLPSKKKINKIAISETTDLIADKISKQIINGDVSKLKVMPIEDRKIKPLYFFLDKEVLLYAKLKNLRFKKTEERKNKISDFIDALEVKHPEIKQAIVKSYLKLYNKR